MNRTMSNPNHLLASTVDTVANCVLATVAAGASIVAICRWAIADRRKVDDQLKLVLRRVDELRSELQREGIQPCRGVRRAREITEEIGAAAIEAKAITASRHPHAAASEPIDQEGWGE